MTHTIRLRGAWVTSSDGATTSYSRNFGHPRTLDAGERVWLVCSSIPATADVWVNDQIVATKVDPGAFAADITELLQPRNSVKFTMSSREPLGEVAMEIRLSAS